MVQLHFFNKLSLYSHFYQLDQNNQSSLANGTYTSLNGTGIVQPGNQETLNHGQETSNATSNVVHGLAKLIRNYNLSGNGTEAENRSDIMDSAAHDSHTLTHDGWTNDPSNRHPEVIQLTIYQVIIIMLGIVACFGWLCICLRPLIDRRKRRSSLTPSSRLMNNRYYRGQYLRSVSSSPLLVAASTESIPINQNPPPPYHTYYLYNTFTPTGQGTVVNGTNLERPPSYTTLFNLPTKQ